MGSKSTKPINPLNREEVCKENNELDIERTQKLKDLVFGQRDTFEYPELILEKADPQELPKLIASKFGFDAAIDLLRRFAKQSGCRLEVQQKSLFDFYLKLVYELNSKITDHFEYFIIPSSADPTKTADKLHFYLKEHLSRINWSFWIEGIEDTSTVQFFLFKEDCCGNLIPGKLVICPIKIQVVTTKMLAERSEQQFKKPQNMDKKAKIQEVRSYFEKRDAERINLWKLENHLTSHKFRFRHKFNELDSSGSFSESKDKEYDVLSAQNDPHGPLKFKSSCKEHIKVVNGELYLLDDCYLWSDTPKLKFPNPPTDLKTHEIEFIVHGVSFGSVGLTSVSLCIKDSISLSFSKEGESIIISTCSQNGEKNSITCLLRPEEMAAVGGPNKITISLATRHSIQWKVNDKKLFVTENPFASNLGGEIFVYPLLLRDQGRVTSDSFIKSIQVKDTPSSLQRKIEAYKTRVLADKEIEDEMKLYVQPLVNYPKRENEGPIHLITALQEKFLTLNSSAKILLLEGETGSGKSIACRYLQRFIFLNQSQEFDNWIPIFIDLEYSDEPAYKAIQKILTQELYLMADEIDELRNGELQVLFIIDRCHQDREAILQKMSDLWDSSKVIFTLNKEKLTELDEDKLLFPPMSHQSNQLIKNSILRLTIMPFTNKMVLQYVQQFTKHYAPSGESGKTLEDYVKYLGDFNFWEPLSLPLTLSLACKALPFSEGQVCRQIQSKNLFDVTQEKQQLQMKKISRRSAYEAFLEKWFKEISGLTDEPKEIILSYAAYLVQKAGKPLVTVDEHKEFKTKKDKLLPYLPTRTYKVFSTAAEVELIHKSFEAYFLAEAMILEISNFQATETYCGFQSQISNFIFGQRILNDDSLTFNFLLDAIRDEKITAKNLVAIIEYSKTTRLHSSSLNLKEGEPIINIESNTDENLPMPHINAQAKEDYFGFAATNAITLLSWIDYDFSFMDLSHVQIPGANLSHGNFTGAKFVGANLKGVNFTCACLRDADFLSADMAGVSFGEYNSSESNQNSFSCFGSYHDELKFATFCRNKVTVFQRDLACCALREVLNFQLEDSIDTYAFNSDLSLLVTSRDIPSIARFKIKIENFGQRILVLKKE